MFRHLTIALLTVAALAQPALADELQDARKLLREGDAPAALALVDRSLAQRGDNPEARFLRGVILSEQKRFADATETFLALTRDYPELPEPYNNLAVLYAARGDLDLARTALLAALRNKPDYAVAHENLGDVYARLAADSYAAAAKYATTSPRVAAKLSLARELATYAPPGPKPAAAAPR